MNNGAVWQVYILECADGTLYTGSTNNLERRVEEHNSKPTGAKYTQARRPVLLRYAKELPDRSAAAKEEARIKALSRAEKLELVRRVS